MISFVFSLWIINEFHNKLGNFVWSCSRFVSQSRDTPPPPLPIFWHGGVYEMLFLILKKYNSIPFSIVKIFRVRYCNQLDIMQNTVNLWKTRFIFRESKGILIGILPDLFKGILWDPLPVGLGVKQCCVPLPPPPPKSTTCILSSPKLGVFL